jgi:hypothetical protein
MFKIQKKELLDKYSRWRKLADLRKLSTEARLRLEWMIQHDQGKSVQSICADFGISRTSTCKLPNPLLHSLKFVFSKKPVYTCE